MKLKYFIVLLSAFWVSNIAFAQNPIIQNILNDVQIDSIIYFVRELTGDTTTVINGNTETILSRHKNSPGNELAFVYIKQKIISYGLQPDSQQFSATGKNVFTEQTGTVFPNKKYLICAHYDNMPVSAIAPGADDNASGTAAVIEAMRILSQYDFPYSIIYALWDEEEQGLVGSNYYATQAASSNDTIIGVINLDMLAWEGNNDSLAFIHTKPVSNSLQLANTMDSMNTLYSIGLNISIRNPGTSASDHASFWNKGFTAIGLSEDYNSDFCPFYHTLADTLAHFNIPYYEKTCKLAYATLAHLALDTTGISSIDNKDTKDLVFLSNYPNPFNGSTKISYTLPVQSEATITIYNSSGNKIKEMARQNQQAGSYEITWDAKGFPSGLYLYELSVISTKSNRVFRNIKKLNLVN